MSIQINFTERYQKIDQISSHDDNLPEIAILPDEILLHIAGFLNSRDLTKIFGETCKFWHTLANETSLWKQLTLLNFPGRLTQKKLPTARKTWKEAFRLLQISERKRQQMAATSNKTALAVTGLTGIRLHTAPRIHHISLDKLH